jgi:hypothetical protein
VAIGHLAPIHRHSPDDLTLLLVPRQSLVRIMSFLRQIKRGETVSRPC